MTLRGILAFVTLVVAQFAALSVQAHALEPGFLDVRELQVGVYSFGWTVPQVEGEPMQITAVLPENCAERRPPELNFTGTSFSTFWTSACTGGITGNTVLIEGLEKTNTDVLMRFEALNGATQTLRMTAENTSQMIEADPGFWAVVKTYFLLGVDHILTGFDHILFVFALVLLVRGNWKLVKTITAFTVAHSITLSAAALGYVSVPVPPVEAVIALSIVFIAVEIARRDPEAPGLAERKPWLVAFAFGLLHGLGFASALAQTGLPQSEIPAALLTFNLGVEAGQLLFVAVVLVLRRAIRLLVTGGQISPASMVIGITVLNYAIGGISAYWLIERVAGFFT
jgi:hydrogenase/urease accessory protein HupE